MKYTNNQVGGVYKRVSDVKLDTESTFLNIIASVVGTMGIFTFILALITLPWSVL